MLTKVTCTLEIGFSFLLAILVYQIINSVVALEFCLFSTFSVQILNKNTLCPKCLVAPFAVIQCNESGVEHQHPFINWRSLFVSLHSHTCALVIWSELICVQPGHEYNRIVSNWPTHKVPLQDSKPKVFKITKPTRRTPEEKKPQENAFFSSSRAESSVCTSVSVYAWYETEKPCCELENSLRASIHRATQSRARTHTLTRMVAIYSASTPPIRSLASLSPVARCHLSNRISYGTHVRTCTAIHIQSTSSAVYYA